MIPADHWHDNGDGTAWLVTGRFDIHEHPRDLDRPCDTCGGDGSEAESFVGGERLVYVDCLDCDGTGRHTFTVEVETPLHQAWERSDRWYDHDHAKHCCFRVSVVPDMVLPIVTSDDWVEGAPCIEANPYGEFWLWPDPGLLYQQGLTLPPAAAPGMWAVKLAVQS